ncbi:uncharacterized protein [Ptychodera flava]|uniref:uncharacterized protein n=1 Tax=Ptychodera flava TaxID=63121 RepID=UPI00396A4FED
MAAYDPFEDGGFGLDQCRYCGGFHDYDDACPAEGNLCNECRKEGHFEEYCRKGKKKKKKKKSSAAASSAAGQAAMPYRKCENCGDDHADNNACPARFKTCKSCWKMGHFEEFCGKYNSSR